MPYATGHNSFTSQYLLLIPQEPYSDHEFLEFWYSNVRLHCRVTQFGYPFYSPYMNHRETTVSYCKCAYTWPRRVRVSLRLAVYRQLIRLGAEHLETHGQNSFSVIEKNSGREILLPWRWRRHDPPKRRFTTQRHNPEMVSFIVTAVKTSNLS
jgi:hypothetical protein